MIGGLLPSLCRFPTVIVTHIPTLERPRMLTHTGAIGRGLRAALDSTVLFWGLEAEQLIGWRQGHERREMSRVPGALGGSDGQGPQKGPGAPTVGEAWAGTGWCHASRPLHAGWGQVMPLLVWGPRTPSHIPKLSMPGVVVRILWTQPWVTFLENILHSGLGTLSRLLKPLL